MRAIPSTLAELWETHSDGFFFLEPVRGVGGELRDLRFTYANAAAARFVGKSREALVDHELLTTLPLNSAHWAHVSHVLETGEPWTLDSLPLHERRLRATVSRLGEGLALLLNDVTPVEDLKHRVATLEDLVDRARLSAEQSKALFETMFESSPIGYAVLDRSHRFVAANKALLSALTTDANVEGRTISELWPDYGLLIEPILSSVLKTGEPRLNNELQVKTADGLKYLLFGTYPVRAGNQILGTGTFVLDMTDRKQVEEFQQQIMGIVGHDLRSPLQAVLIGTQGMLRSPRANEEQRSSLLRIQRCARRMTRLIDDLADFTRMRVGQPIAIHLRSTNIDEVCRQALAEMEALYPGRLLNYRGSGTPDGYWDSNRLVQVLTNLISNAFKYSPTDSPIDVTWRREPTMGGQLSDLIIEVRNAGAPIEPQLLPYIFEPFRRGSMKDPLARTSLGLGLYIVKYLVEAHSGSVSVASDDTGTVFRVRLPSMRPVSMLTPRVSSGTHEALPAFVEAQQGTC